MSRSDVVFHFTDTARLPWILASGELRPGRNQLGGFPDPDFLWATTSPIGDRSASGGYQGYREGVTRLVRITLQAEDFEPWPQITARFPAWTADHSRRLESAARQSSPQGWRCRVEPLPRHRWLAIETRTYVDKQWRALPLDVLPGALDPVAVNMSPSDKVLGIEIDGQVYCSTQGEGPNGSYSYQVARFYPPKMLRKVIRRRRSRSGLSAILWMHLQLCFGPQ
jgi:hypothetical protein